LKDPILYHQQNVEKLTLDIQALRVKRNTLTALKLSAFVAIAIFAVLVFTDYGLLQLIILIASLLVFIGIAVLDEKTTNLYFLKKELKKVSQLELAYLNRDFNDLDQGLEFKNGKHNYSNDLDLFGSDSLFQAINRTVTKKGKSKLAEWLLGSIKSQNEIVETQKGVNELKGFSDWRLFFRATGNLKGLDEKESDFSSWLDPKTFFNKKWTPTLYIIVGLNALIILAAVLGYIDLEIPFYTSGVLLFIAFRFLGYISKVHQKLDVFAKNFAGYHKLIKQIGEQDFKSERLNAIKATLFEGKHNSALAFQKVSKILNSFDQRSNVLVTVMFNALYMRDIFLLIELDKWKEKYNPFLLSWIDSLAEVDALSCLANYHFNHPEFIYPTPVENTIISAKELGHPAIPKANRVCNDFEISANHRMDIVTGANMAGKSTFLRTVGVNLILAKCGGPVCASTFEFKPITLFTSMRTSDDLADETSYFHAELLRLKQLVNITASSQQVFIILDEILKGTNSTDKLNGSKRFLTRLLQLPVSGLVATHDLELGRLEKEYPENFKNTCFEIAIDGNEIDYDYKLKSGVSQNMNATLLMESMDLI
jgi:hypothetical protein